MNKNLTFLLLLVSLTALSQRISFDENWKFQLDEQKGAELVDYNDRDWRVLDVPHDWSIEGEYAEDNPMTQQCGYLPAGIGWYRKTIKVPKQWKDKHVEISFDGVFMNSTVWVNGRELGTRPFGWISFNYNISPEVNTSEEITITVRVDNDKQPSARWYTGSGIYAHTWIDVKDKIHVATNGVFVRTEGSKIKINTEIANKSSKDSKLKIKTSIFDSQGKLIKTIKRKVKIASNESVTIEQETVLGNPLLWSVENPTLYTVVSEVYSGNTLKDKFKTKFGIRDIEWIPETGMWINGKNVKLQGVCNHQDAGALGAAVPDKIVRFRIQQLKDMGVNAIRTAHNPQTPIFYELCDEMGILVMDEIFDGWKKKAANDYGAHSFDEWWQQDITDWIKRDRNHPSIVIYSVGNETRGDVGKDLVELCHKLDNTRPVTSGHSGPEFMDVLGVNGHSEHKGFFDEMPRDKVFIGTENTHTWQVRGYYRTKTWFRDGYPNEKKKPYELPDLTEKEVFTHDWTTDINKSNHKQIFNSSYDNAMVRLSSRLNIEQLRDIPNYAGSFRWTGHDYIGEAGYVHGGWPFKSFMGGAIDMANFEKDLFYLYQSQWTNKPMVHILPHWTHPKMGLGTEIPVWIYSNCDVVELFFDGKSLGKQNPGKKWNKMQCQWMVPWKPGELKAIGYNDGFKISEEVISTAHSPSKIALSVDGEPLKSFGKDIVQVRVTTTDNKGEMCPYGENRTHFKVLGAGKIRALDNGSPIDIEKHFEASDRIAFYGLTRAYVESFDNDKPVSILASCILGEKKLITSNKVSIDTQLLALRGKLPKSDIEIYYSIDGSLPTVNSIKYINPFEVTLGTTVKAIVILNGEELQQLEERFAEDEGFVWNKNQQDYVIIGEQAEDAKIVGGTVFNKGVGYNGKGFVKLDKAVGTSIEWYQENDGSSGEADLYIRYSVKVDGGAGTYIKVLVNDEVVNDKFFLRNTRSQGGRWNKVKLPIKLNRGANTIQLSTIDDSGIYIDEIIIN